MINGLSRKQQAV